jgi:hypothetical protein
MQTIVHACAAALCLTVWSSASAQRTTYNCSADGRTYLSDRPCAGRPATALASIGPAANTRSGSDGRERQVGRAESHLDYLSPLCAELNEGLRNGPARGLGSRAVSELASSYRERCGDEDQQARRRVAEEQKKRREARDDDVRAENVERARAKLSREQCDEMYRIAHGKLKKLSSMTPGERSDFDRFEANRQARCSSG